MDYEEILKTMSRWMEAYKPICDKDDSPLFQLEPPATEEEISAVEKQINRRLPDSLRTFFLCHARYLKLTAYFSDDFLKKLPSSIHSLFSAFLELSLDNLPLLNESCQEAIHVCLVEPEHPSAALLQNVLPLTWVPCGDYLIFDYSQDAFESAGSLSGFICRRISPLCIGAFLRGFSEAAHGSRALWNRGFANGSFSAKQNRRHPA